LKIRSLISEIFFKIVAIHCTGKWSMVCHRDQFWGHFYYCDTQMISENVQGAKLVLFADDTGLLIA
jgi:hypothetical protein